MAVSSATQAPPLQAPGLGSNLDVQGLVSKLMTVESQPLDALNQKESGVTLQISALATYRSSLSSFQGSLAALENASSYTAMSATVGDTSVATASSNPGADAGSHTLEVTNLAQAQRLKSNTFQNITDTVGTGTLTIQFGTYDSTGNTFTLNGKRATQTIAIDSAHNTLAGVRDAINAANAGVTASIVNDGTGNRLVLASSSTGTANGIKISVADDDGNNTDGSGLSQLAYDPTAAAGAGQNLSQVIKPQDAQFLLDGLSITKSSNTVTDVLSGTTINLLKTNTGNPTTLVVGQNTSQAKTAIDAFVKAYNDLNASNNTLTGYDASTKTAGTLQADAGVRSLNEQIRSTVSQLFSAAPGGYRGLAQIGITFDSSGNLQEDTAKLTSALQTNPAAVQSLFATSGQSNDSLATYSSSTSNTPAGTYAVNVSQLATQGQAVGSGAAALTIDATNDALTVTVNGITSSVTIPHATYASADALAATLQSTLNGSDAFLNNNVSVSVTQNNGVLTLGSTAYGSTSKVALNGGSAQAALFGAAPTSTNGVDVAGTIGSVTAAGFGQQLVSPNGLTVSVTGGSTGARGSITFTRGLAVQLDSLLSNALGTTGVIASQTNGFNDQIKAMDKQRDDLNAQLAQKQQQYMNQFNTLDGLISTMNSTMSYLSQQLASLNSSTK